MEKISARHRGEKNIYIHNQLSAAAKYFKGQIQKRIADDNLKGINFEYMALLIILAFTFEAIINFLGHKKRIVNWNERDKFNKKVNKVFNYLKLKPDKTKRPYISIEILKDFRDYLAHGKPVEYKFDHEIIGTAADLDRKIDLDYPLELFYSKENVFNTFDDVYTVLDKLVKAAGLEPFDLLTSGFSRISNRKKLDDRQE